MKSASDIMTRRLKTVSLDDGVRKAYQLMQESKIRHLPVTDGSGRVIGMISDRDLHKAMTPRPESPYLESNDAEFAPDLAVKDFMSWPVKSVPGATKLENVVDIMLESRCSAVLIESSPDHFSGIITTDDLLRLLLALLKKGGGAKKLSLDHLITGEYQSFLV